MNDIVASLFDVRQWAKRTAHEVIAAAGDLTPLVAPEFEWNEVIRTSSGLSLATFRHRSTGMIFHLIPGGRDALGLSAGEFDLIESLPNAELDLLASLRPEQEVEVEPFLMSQLPLLEDWVLPNVPIDRSLFRPDFQPLSGEQTFQVPIYLARNEAIAALGQFGFMMPTESQWEYATRGGTDTPFYFGARLPEDKTLSEILTTDFRTVTPAACNPFGIVGLLVGGWCVDSMTADRWHGIDNGPPHVVRGGAAVAWPWQNGGEWMMALSAMRMSSEHLEDSTCSTHAVVPLSR